MVIESRVILTPIENALCWETGKMDGGGWAETTGWVEVGAMQLPRKVTFSLSCLFYNAELSKLKPGVHMTYTAELCYLVSTAASEATYIHFLFL